MTIFFLMASPEYRRFYDSTIEALAARGHEVVLAVNSQREKKPVGLDGLRAFGDRVRVAGVVPRHEGIWGAIGQGVRGVTDFVRYLHPRFARASTLRARMKRKALPAAFAWLDYVPSLPAAVVRRLVRVLAACERAVPVSPAVVACLREARPDVLLVSPLVDAASDQVEWLKAAREAGVRTAVCVASWDNLTNKGLLRLEPDRLVVWNEAQKREAIDFHYVAPARVVATGAQLFDRWFTQAPSRGREAFCARVGLADARPFVLFTGSSSFISESNAEVAFVRRWIAALAASTDPRVRDLQVLVRPHPYNCHAWETADLSDLPHVALWPRRGYSPVSEENRADFFDSLFHSAAVVGVNTSAMIEAAIVGRPVLSMLSEDFGGTQEGTLHFHHLLPENGGFVRIAADLDAHVAQLGERLRHPDAARAEIERFVASFVRPHGVGTPATPFVAEAIESVTTLPLRPPIGVPASAWLLRPILLVVGLGAAAIAQARGPHPLGRARKHARQWASRARKRTTRVRALAASRLQRVRKRASKQWRKVWARSLESGRP